MPLACALLTACGGTPSDAPSERVGVATSAITVQEAIDAGCSTTLVAGLSMQILAQANCNDPGAYVPIPPTEGVSLGSAVIPYMQAPARDALATALESNAGEPMQINSMLRTVAQQYLLYDWYKRGRCGIKLAATPGRSNHQSGLAVDIAEPGTWKKIMRKHGFRWMGKRDRWHFDYDGEEARRGLDVKAFQRLWNRNHPDDEIRADGDWGETTERALRMAPADGFPTGAICRFGDND